jgi:hypothetical protein
MPTFEPIFKFILEILAYSGGAAVVAYFLFKFLGKTWIENKFEKNLELYRHLQAIEIQRLRVEIDSMLSGALKLQDREFHVLPKAWEKLDEAYGRVSSLVSPMQSYPDLNRMNDLELSEFFQQSELAESQKKKIEESHDKTKAYIDIIFWHRLNKVRFAIGELRDFTARNNIFLTVELKQKFKSATDLLWSALVSKKVGVEAKDHKMQTQGWEQIKTEVEPLYRSIESEIQKRLLSHGRKASDS